MAPVRSIWRWLWTYTLSVCFREMILIRKRGKSYDTGVVTQQQPEFFSNSMLASPWPAIDVDNWARHDAMAESVSKKICSND